TVTNCNFAQGSNFNLCYSCATNAGGSTIKYCNFDGGSGAPTFANDALGLISINGNVANSQHLWQYNHFTNLGAGSFLKLTGLGTGSQVFTIQYNLLERGQFYGVTGSDTDFIRFFNVPAAININFNTFYQPNVDSGVHTPGLMRSGIVLIE